MKFFLKHFLFPLSIVFLFKNANSVFLLFPADSVLQITASLAIPIDIPGRKLYLDYGYQFNFVLPWNPAQLYNPKIWPTKSGRKRDVAAVQTSEQKILRNTTLYNYDSIRGEQRLYHPHDFTAGELYQNMENMLMRYGFHETCLLRAVCELARHPFADGQENILTETLTFVLTPSLHDAFADTEQIYREVYESAEEYGFYGENCQQLYPECQKDILSIITQVILPTT